MKYQLYFVAVLMIPLYGVIALLIIDSLKRSIVERHQENPGDKDSGSAFSDGQSTISSPDTQKFSSVSP